MSYSIVYRHVLLKLSMARALTAMKALLPDMAVSDYDAQLTHGQYSTGVLLFAEAGSSNTFDLDNRRVRSWCMPFLGGGWGGPGYIEAIIDDSKSVETGMLRLAEIRNATPEKFIGFHRKLLEGGLPFEATPHSGGLDRSPIVYLRMKMDPERFAPSELGLLERINNHPFTPWVDSNVLGVVGEKQSAMTTDFTWRLSLDLSDPTRREAILGWLIACAGPSRASAIVELDYPDRGALDGWLEQIWRETAAARAPRRRA